MHPFLNLKGLSDNQLFDKVHELSEYVRLNSATGANQAVTTQLELSLLAVYQEIEDRSSLKRAATKEKENPVSWDMDASLTIKRSRVNDAESENKSHQKRRWRPTERQRRNRGSQ